MIRSTLFFGTFAAMMLSAPAAAKADADFEAELAAALAILGSDEPDQRIYVTEGVDAGEGRPVCIGICGETRVRGEPDMRLSRSGPIPSAGASVQGRRPTAPQAAVAPASRSNRLVASTGTPQRAVSQCDGRQTVAMPGQLGPHMQFDVTFATGSAELRSGANHSLDLIAAAIRSPQSAGQVFVVSGHADCSGLASRNLELSQDRAEAVVAALVERDVPADRLRAIGFGEERRIAGEAATSERLRRVEVARLLN